jgi:hypothetical protein
MTERTGGPPVPSSPRSSLTPYLVFACISWLLAAALLVAALKPGVIRDPGQAAALKPWALGLAMMLAVWSAITLVVAKRSKALDQQGRDGPPARPGTTEVVAQERASRPPVLAKAGVNVSPLACVLATTSILFGVLVIVRPAIDIRGTKPLALEFAALAQPGDKVYHYHGFFHDFTYYSGRTVGLVDYRDELEPENDDPAAMARILISDADFRAQWAGSGRVFAVARKQAAKELFADPAFHYRLLGEDPGHYLFSNR